MHQTRRKFLFAALGTGAALAAGAAWRKTRAATAVVNRTGYALGAPVSLTIAHARESQAARALDAAFRELQVVEELFSLYRPASQLRRLNREGRLVDPHPYMAQLLRESLALSRRTAGAFDVTVQPLWSAYADAARQDAVPSDTALSAALARVDWRQIELTSDLVVLRAGGEVTFNGIAQGFAADRVLDVLRRHGVEHALADTGEVGALGGKDAQTPWTVGIQHPRRPDAFLSLAKLAGRCLATSGDYATTFGEGFQNHHIFDPRTGHSPAEFASVSVAARTAAQADALSTAVFVLGVERGLQLIRATPDADAMLVLKDGASLSTERFPVASTT